MIRKDEVKCLKHWTGEKGESLARKYFEQREYEIITTNWRHGHWEIDIIASKAEKLHIIEVKTRNSVTGGFPEENVDHKKMITLTKAAEAYTRIDKRWRLIQFDILAITLGEGEPDFFLLEDVYL
ncbi:MAG TPA: YraN family protein [Saprospiraceae bacterium]|nr:YraN family protein [Saprospiraceae bacterium]